MIQTILRKRLKGSDNKLEESALRILSFREHSERELFNKLRQRGFEVEKILKLLERLKKTGVLDDRRFAVSYARWRRKKLYGNRRIYTELLNKGVDRELIEEAIEIISHEMGEEVAARELAKKKGTSGEKLFRFLLQRGFSVEIAREVAEDEDI